MLSYIATIEKSSRQTSKQMLFAVPVLKVMMNQSANNNIIITIQVI